MVTGAGSGIGRGVALALARRGCHLALADVSEEGMAGTAGLALPHGVRVTAHRLDVGDRDQVADFPARVAAEHPRVDVLVNNAGVALGGTFERVSEADFEWLFGINFWGVVRMTRAFLPLLRASDDARLVNVSSVFGLVAPAAHVPYAASKFAVRGFSEALRHELEGSNVGVTVVHPGGVATAIAEVARDPADATEEEVRERREHARKFLRLPPEVAGETIVRGVERRKARVLVGADARAISLLARVMPVSYWKAMKRGSGL